MAFWMALAALSAFDNAAKPAAPRVRAGWGLLAGCLALSLFALPSRSGFLAMSAGAAFLSFRHFRWRGILYGAMIVLFGVALVPDSIWKKSFKLNDPLAWKRLDIWTSTARGIAAKPLLGWGPGNFESLYNAKALPQPSLPVRFDRSTPFAHNEFLQAAAEYGVPALAFLVFGLACAWRSGMDAGKKSILLAASVFSLFNFPFFVPVNGWLLAGLLAVNADDPEPANGPSTPKRWLAGLLVLMCLISFAIAGVRMIGSGVNPWNVNEKLDAADKLLHETPSPGPVNVSEAESILRRALRFSPANARAWRDLGHLNSDHKKPPMLEESMAAMGRAVELHPTQALWALEWGETALRLGDRNASLRAVHRALALEPSYAGAALLIGSVLRQSGESAKAEAWLKGYLSRYESPKSPSGSLSSYARIILHLDVDAFRLEIARCQSARKDYSNALNTLSRISSDPGGMRSFEEAGVHYAMGKYPLAERALVQALRVDKDNPFFIRNLDLVRRKNK